MADLPPPSLPGGLPVRRTSDGGYAVLLADEVHAEPAPLTPDQVRQLLRECVTVVKPGETLVLRIAGLTTGELWETQRAVDEMSQHAGWPKIIVLAGDELGVIAAPEATDG